MRSCMIVCAGSTIKKYNEKILFYRQYMVVIGVNNVYDFCTPDIHLWTNLGRFKEFCRPSSAIIVFGEQMYKKISSEETTIYHETPKNITTIHDDIKKWRTAGVRAIQYAHDNGFKEILVVGMDGYTLLHDGSQHCYGQGMTDNNDMETEKEKDDIVYTQLRRMWDEGIRFKILTPTVFKDFYEEGVL